MGLLTLMVLGFCPDLLRWLQIPCYCAKFGNIDESVSSSFFLFSFYNFRVILFGLWFRDLSASHDFVASCSNLAVSISVVCGFAGFLAAREAEKISVRVCFMFFRLGWASICLGGFYHYVFSVYIFFI